MDRISLLKEFIERRPGDPFPRYGLAMEYRKGGDLGQAQAAFADLLGRFPDYLPTYLMAGGTLATLGRREEAIDVYRRGIALARTQGQEHAAGELEAALADLVG